MTSSFDHLMGNGNKKSNSQEGEALLSILSLSLHNSYPISELPIQNENGQPRKLPKRPHLKKPKRAKV